MDPHGKSAPERTIPRDSYEELNVLSRCLDVLFETKTNSVFTHLALVVEL